ncbi:MAG: metallophosphoesterase [Deltaproteobacteria bacterium]|nr:metallophosphoesterase [Deltaproteobacteria bacterium]
MTKVTIIGDTHGHLDKLIEAIPTDTDFVLQVGDFGIFLDDSNLNAIPKRFHSSLGQFQEYYSEKKGFPVPVYFCKGNHEDFLFLTNYNQDKPILPNLYYVPNGTVLTIQGVTVGFFGGNYSPKWFERDVPANMQSQKILGYFNQTEIKTLRKSETVVDILITHEPCQALDFGSDRYGCEPIQKLIEELQPTYAFSGHIHKYAEGTIGRTKCVGLGAINYQGRSTFDVTF